MLRSILMKILPQSWTADMERESREWTMRCHNCNFEQSIWDAGGLRWKAKGNPVRMRVCPNCRQLTAHTVYRRENQPQSV